MVKQVKNAVVETAVTTIPQDNNGRHLYVTVETFDNAGKNIGNRIVDMYHFGTRSWLQNHTWWAMHNGHSVQTETSNDTDITAYLAEQTVALAAKYNGTHETVAA